jgi:hypothetical protein
MSPTYRVVKPYQSAYPDPIIFCKGEPLTTSNRQTDWPSWFWCTTANSESRWVPDVYIEEIKGQRVMRCDYNPMELSVQSGELLTLTGDAVNGWAWCTNAANQQGWVPLECLQAIQEEE